MLWYLAISIQRLADGLHVLSFDLAMVGLQERYGVLS